MIETAILIVMVVVSLAIIGLILIQQGKGADMGAAFGSGASNTVFGSQGTGNFLTRTTAILVTIFFICCLALAWFANNKGASTGGIDFSAPAAEQKSLPAAADVPAIDAAPAASDVPSAEVPAAAADVPAASQETAPATTGEAAPAAAETSAPAAAAPAAVEGEQKNP